MSALANISLEIRDLPVEQLSQLFGGKAVQLLPAPPQSAPTPHPAAPEKPSPRRIASGPAWTARVDDFPECEDDPPHSRISDINALLQLAPSEIVEVPGWLGNLKHAQMDTVWVAAIIDALDQAIPPYPLRAVAAALNVVRDSYRTMSRVSPAVATASPARAARRDEPQPVSIEEEDSDDDEPEFDLPEPEPPVVVDGIELTHGPATGEIRLSDLIPTTLKHEVWTQILKLVPNVGDEICMAEHWRGYEQLSRRTTATNLAREHKHFLYGHRKDRPGNTMYLRRIAPEAPGVNVVSNGEMVSAGLEPLGEAQ